jgi:hypothetical protein
MFWISLVACSVVHLPIRSAIFFHIHCHGRHWSEVVADMLISLMASRRLAHGATLHLGVLGQSADVARVKALVSKILGAQAQQVHYLYSLGWAKHYEMLTLESVYQACNDPSKPLDWVSYLHSKGTTVGAVHQATVNENATPRAFRLLRANARLWRQMAEHFVLHRFYECVQAVPPVELCGPFWSSTPWPHFSGNFWSATCSHVRGLSLAHLYGGDRYLMSISLPLLPPQRVLFFYLFLSHFDVVLVFFVFFFSC